MDRMVQEFLLFLRVEKGLVPQTITSYRNLLLVLLTYLQEEQRISQWNQVSHHHLRDFLHQLTEKKKVSASTRSGRVTIIKAFFSYLYLEGIIDKPIAERLVRPKREKKLPVYLTLKECQRFIEIIQERSKDRIRDQCIILTFLYTGIRLSELHQVNMQDLQLDRETLKVIGKGRKERLVPIAPPLKEELHAYLTYRQQLLSSQNRNVQALFVEQGRRSVKRISISTIRKIFQHYASDAVSHKKHITPHKLRHTFATLLYASGVDLLQLKQLLGHTSISTSQIYTHTSTKQLVSAIEKHPLNILENFAASTYSKSLSKHYISVNRGE